MKNELKKLNVPNSWKLQYQKYFPNVIHQKILEA